MLKLYSAESCSQTGKDGVGLRFDIDEVDS